MKLSEIKDIFCGEILRDGCFSTLEYCTAQCDDPFLTFLEKDKYIEKINLNATCVITTSDLAFRLPSFIQGIVIADEPKKTFVLIHNYFARNGMYNQKRFDSVIGSNCKISSLAYVAPHNVIIGDNVIIEPFSVVKENVSIGNNCLIHENTVIGGKSFNFTKCKDGSLLGMEDCGQVILKDNVEICSNCHIANGPLPTDVTLLEEYVKLDALVHIGHGTKVGKGTLIPAGAQIAGNVNIGSEAWIGVNATIANRINIGDGGRVSLGSVVTKDVGDGQTVTGNFAIEHIKFIQNLKREISEA